MRDPLTYFLSPRADQYLRLIGCIVVGRTAQEIRGIKNEPANKLVKAQIAQDEIEALARDAKTAIYRVGSFRLSLTFVCVVCETQSVAVFAALLGISLIWLFE
jgi:hypothetical protein